MDQTRVCFIHATDLHLEQPLWPGLELPPHMLDLAVEAPFRAAERITQHALAEHVDFVVLTGDLLDPRLTGPFAAAFLAKQFEQLAERNIPVYWIAGNVDHPRHWQFHPNWPDNVHFAAGRSELLFHTRAGQPLAQLVLLGTDASEFINRISNPRQENLPIIVVSYGIPSPQQRKPFEASVYWAVGGRHSGFIRRSRQTTFGCPGQHQARKLREKPGRCFLVRLGTNSAPEIESLPCDWAALLDVLVEAPTATSVADLERTICQKAQHIRGQWQAQLILVRWKIEADRKLLVALQDESLRRQLVEVVREQLAVEEPLVWTLAIQPAKQPRPKIPNQNEESFAAEFVRCALKTAQQDTALQLQELFPDRVCDDAFLSQAAGVAARNVDRLTWEAIRVGLTELRYGENCEELPR